MNIGHKYALGLKSLVSGKRLYKPYSVLVCQTADVCPWWPWRCDRWSPPVVASQHRPVQLGLGTGERERERGKGREGRGSVVADSCRGLIQVSFYVRIQVCWVQPYGYTSRVLNQSENQNDWQRTRRGLFLGLGRMESGWQWQKYTPWNAESVNEFRLYIFYLKRG